MDFATMLYGLLSAGAALAATEGAKTLGKEAVTAAFDAIKARLTGAHAVKGLDLVGNPDFAEGLTKALAKPGIAADPDVAALAEALRAAIAALPAGADYAVDVRGAIEAARNVTARDIEGLRAAGITAKDGDVTLERIKAPPGKP
jgi:hypothetical protein